VRSEVLVAVDLWLAEVDGAQIGQVIRNLVLNAREAMPSGGLVTLHAKNVALEQGLAGLLPAGDYVQIAVTDQGLGIPPDVLPKIFDPYFSTKTRGTDKGMGLGLTICHSVVKKHGGAMTVSSSPSGTTFHVYLPASGHGVPNTKPSEGHRGRLRGRVLVMDDEPTMRTVMARMLKQLGCEVGLATDGESAMALYLEAKRDARPFDVVILDLTVRGAMGGKDAARALLATEPLARIVVMSGHSEDEVLRDYSHHGFRGALAKPFDRATLIEVLERAMTG
jgi:CheY-like chemotaxis protein